MYQSDTWLLSLLWTVSVFTTIFGYRLAIGWLHVYPKFNTLQDIPCSYILLCTKGTHGCYQILWAVVCLQDFLAIGWLCSKINTLQDMVIYNVPKLHMNASNTLDCNAFTKYLDM